MRRGWRSGTTSTSTRGSSHPGPSPRSWGTPSTPTSTSAGRAPSWTSPSRRCRALGVLPDRIFIERFLVERQEKTDALIVDENVVAGATAPEEVTVVLGGKKNVVRYRPGDTLLETARRGGLRPPFSCEAGNCATCMAFLKEGSVTMRANNALTPEEVDEGWVLTCQSLPSGRVVTVEYESL